MAQRSVANTDALTIAYRTGRINQAAGGIPSVPIIDTRDYVRRSRPTSTSTSTATSCGRGSSEPTGPTPTRSCSAPAASTNVQPMRDTALDQMGQPGWTRSRRTTPRAACRQKVIADKPADAVDACWIGGNRINEPAVIGGTGPCQTTYPPHSLPRLVAGMPINSFVAKCQLQPLKASDYGSPSPAQLTRLHQIFPNGVCDFSKAGVGEQGLSGTWQSFGPPQNVIPQQRGLKLRARRVRTKGGAKTDLVATLRPCPEVTWQPVTFERRRGRRYRGIKSPFVDGKQVHGHAAGPLGQGDPRRGEADHRLRAGEVQRPLRPPGALLRCRAREGGDQRRRRLAGQSGARRRSRRW